MRLLKIDFQTKTLISAENLPDAEAIPAQEQLSEKPAFFDKLFATESVLMSADSTRDKVQLPASITVNRIILLKWIKKHQGPDFGYDNFGIFGTLQFGQTTSFVMIPWDSVIKLEGVTSGKNQVWIDQMVT